MKIGTRIHLNNGRAAKFDGDPMIDKPRMGYNWFYWLPVFRTNGGNPFEKQVLDIRFSWFHHWFGFTLYPSWINDKENQAQKLTIKKE